MFVVAGGWAQKVTKSRCYHSNYSVTTQCFSFRSSHLFQAAFTDHCVHVARSTKCRIHRSPIFSLAQTTTNMGLMKRICLRPWQYYVCHFFSKALISEFGVVAVAHSMALKHLLLNSLKIDSPSISLSVYLVWEQNEGMGWFCTYPVYLFGWKENRNTLIPPNRIFPWDVEPTHSTKSVESDGSPTITAGKQVHFRLSHCTHTMHSPLNSDPNHFTEVAPPLSSLHQTGKRRRPVVGAVNALVPAAFHPLEVVEVPHRRSGPRGWVVPLDLVLRTPVASLYILLSPQRGRSSHKQEATSSGRDEDPFMLMAARSARQRLHLLANWRADQHTASPVRRSE